MKQVLGIILLTVVLLVAIAACGETFEKDDWNYEVRIGRDQYYTNTIEWKSETQICFSSGIKARGGSDKIHAHFESGCRTYHRIEVLEISPLESVP